MNCCDEINRLLEEYDAATARLLQAIDRLAEASTLERAICERIADEARRMCGETMAAVQVHRLAHQCCTQIAPV